MICDDYLDFDKLHINLIKKPKKIFVKTDLVDYFKYNILPKIDFNFKLVTHNSDYGVREKDLDLLNNEKLIHWFGMNCHIKHAKLTPIPIGIANERYEFGNEELLSKIISLKIPKKNKIYCNFDVKTNPQRNEIKEILKFNSNIDIEFERLNQKDYWEKLASYNYVISPPGNGVDCHRIWESIYLNTIPICLKNICLDSFKNLPIIFVDDFNDISFSNINTKIEDLKYDFTYWENKI